jgi:hypothetical protein
MNFGETAARRSFYLLQCMSLQMARCVISLHRTGNDAIGATADIAQRCELGASVAFDPMYGGDYTEWACSLARSARV